MTLFQMTGWRFSKNANEDFSKMWGLFFGINQVGEIKTTTAGFVARAVILPYVGRN